MMPKTSRWYAIVPAQNNAPAEIHLFDDIGYGDCKSEAFCKELKTLGGQDFTLRINSRGGHVFEGNAIYNAIARYKGTVTAHVESLAASMASVIAMAADKVVMSENSMMMVHNPWTMTAGDASDLRKEADTLDRIKTNIVRAYARKSKRSEEEVSELMDAETWMSAEQAYEFGFVDEIEKPNEAAASIKPEELRARVANFMAKTNTPPAPPAVDTTSGKG
jgi:ATP-dependent Clp endopeptidase proteolytic subunit ClpP